jgi:predicted O-methyltransferase YrrM
MTAMDKISRRIGGIPLGPREASQATLLIASLRREGWLRSTKRGALGTAGEQVPWLTYAAIRWLDRVLRPHHRVFEFGSGSSTIWLALRVKSIISIEHDASWERVVRAHLPTNATLHLAETRGDENEAPENDPYTSVLKDVDGQFDLLLVDGMARNTCVRLAVDHLTDSGVILLDDADRLAYRPAHEHLRRHRFGRLDFFGPKPGAGYLSTTCAFSRNFDAWLHDLEPPAASGY